MNLNIVKVRGPGRILPRSGPWKLSPKERKAKYDNSGNSKSIDLEDSFLMKVLPQYSQISHSPYRGECFQRTPHGGFDQVRLILWNNFIV
jgi:hypothetical protein